MNIRGGLGRFICRPQAVYFGIPEYADLDFSLDNWSQLDWANRYWDIFRKSIDTKRPFGPYCIVFGTSQDDRQIIHDEPSYVPYSAAQDHSLFNSILGNIGRALSVLDDRKSSRTFASEHGVTHGTSSGDVYPPGSTIWFAPDGGTHTIPNGFGTIPTYTVAAGRPTLITGHPATFIGSAGSYSSNILLTDLIDEMSKHIGQTWSVITAPWEWLHELISCTYTHEDGLFEMVFVQDSTSWWGVEGSGTWYKSRFTTTYSIQTIPVVRPVYGRDLTVRYDGHFPVEHLHTYDLQVERLATVHGDAEKLGGANVNGHVHATFGYMTRPCAKVNTVDTQETVDLTVKYLTGLDRLCENNMADLYSAAYVSASSAIVDHHTFLEQNYLESVSELGEIMKLFPDTSGLEDFLNLLPQGRVLSGTLRMIDFAANAHLLYQFGLLTLQADLIEFATKYDQIAERLRFILASTQRDLRGKFVYTFVDGPLLGFQLVVRSKVVIRFPRSGVATALLPGEIVGLNPTPSRIWEMLPFSFVVDWFTNNSRRWKLGEGAVRAMTAVVYYSVHSYSLHKTGLDDNPYGLNFSHGASYKYYVRLPSLYFPGPPITSRYDWLAVTQPPSLKTAAALLWATIR